MAAKLIAKRGRSTLILVHRKPLLEQWLAGLDEFLNLDDGRVGVVGAGKRKPTGCIDGAIVQSLARKELAADQLAGYGQIVQEIYATLASDTTRADLIAEDVRSLLNEGRAPLVLTERRKHLDHLADRLRAHAETLVTLHGGVTPRRRRDALAELNELPADAPRVVLTTGRFIGEGFDDPRLDTLLLTMPIAWKGTVIQYAGRLHRPHPGKHEARIYDYVDQTVPVLRRMFVKRARSYRSMGYTIDETPQPLQLTHHLTRSTNDFHDRYLGQQLRDPIFRHEYERSKRRLEAIDAGVKARPAGAARESGATRNPAPAGGKRSR